MKAVIQVVKDAELLVENKLISKIGNLVKIVIDGTKTDITMELVSQYTDDIITIKTDRIKMWLILQTT